MANFCYAQTIKGTVKHADKEISTASILFKDLLNNQYVKEYALLKNGQFDHRLKETYVNLLIEIKSEGYQDEIIIVKSPVKNKVYAYQVVLKKDTTYLLGEATIVAQKRFEIKEDTVVFNVQAYQDGSERKIEDIIKKLPGIEVNEQSGEIKYKGKSIETVTLDGDNLFGFNYSLGTKNINVDMVNQVEAIENYSENPILKGIEQEGKVSLNLKLEKGKLDFSGNIDVGAGYMPKEKAVFDMNSNLLGITKTYKSFATISYNNVGNNQTPFDYFGYNPTVEELREKDFFTGKIIPEIQFSNFLDNKRTNINNQWFGNYNVLFNLSKRISVKANLYYLKDEITSNQVFVNQFQINNQNFKTTDDTFIAKRPTQYRGDVALKYHISKKSLFEYHVKIRQVNTETPIHNIQNETVHYTNFLASKDYYLKQRVLWTKKLADKKALQISAISSFNNLPQSLSIADDVSNDLQQSTFQKKHLAIESILLGAKVNNKYSFTFGASADLNPYSSDYFHVNNEILSHVPARQNNFNYRKNKVFNSGVLHVKKHRWEITPSYSISFLHQSLNNKISNEVEVSEKFVAEPSLGVKYKVNTRSFLEANVSFNQSPNDEQFFFVNEVLIDSRTQIKNAPSLAFQKKIRSQLSYYLNDLYKQFSFYANLTYQDQTGNYFSNLNVTENSTLITYFYLPQSNRNWQTNMSISKYIPDLKSTFKLNSRYGVTHFNNIVNQSNLRRNINQFLNNNFFWKTAFNMPVNFENSITWQYSKSKNDSQLGFANSAFQNTSKIIFKPTKKWFIILSSDYYLPSVGNFKEKFHFIDATIRYRPTIKRWESCLSLKNLTNQSSFEQIQISDISTSIFNSNLLARYFLLNVSWNF